MKQPIGRMLRHTPIIRKLWDTYEATLLQRDTAAETNVLVKRAEADRDHALQALERANTERDAALTERELVLAGRDAPGAECYPLGLPHTSMATKDDIYYCFRLIIGRNPNPEEWPGHSSQAGEDLYNVVRHYITSSEFAARGMLNKSYLDAVELIHLPKFAVFVSKDDLAVSRGILQTGAYEPHVSAVLDRYLMPGMTALDIGANIGYLTMHMATLVGPLGHVIAIEPNPENVVLIEASRRTNGFEQVSIIQAAAGRDTGVLALNLAHCNGMTGDLSPDLGAMLGSRPVPCFALDAVLPNDRRIDLIKIDVEGAELNALAGLEKTINRDEPLIVSEFSPGMMQGTSACPGLEYLNFLIQKGYAVSVIDSNGEIIGDDSADSVMAIYHSRGVDHIDIICRPASRATTPARTLRAPFRAGSRSHEDRAMEPWDEREYVRWAYRLLLGREPENEAAIERHPFLGDRKQLLQACLHSAEFRHLHGATFAIPQDLFLLHEGRLEVTRDLIMRRGDPVRDMTVALALETIDREGIEGDMAELGVYQGAMAVLYQKVLPSKKLYLFDTFTGFPTTDLNGSEDTRFSDTSLEYVKSRIGDDSNVIFKPGYFPETVSGMENCQFCFVMLDADLYNPTKAGLEFFYPRMSRGGYIFLHDYTSNESNQAVSRAAAEFLADKPEKVIEIPDTWGSALFRKL